jgi:hypothetical protein
MPSRIEGVLAISDSVKSHWLDSSDAILKAEERFFLKWGLRGGVFLESRGGDGTAGGMFLTMEVGEGWVRRGFEVASE